MDNDHSSETSPTSRVLLSAFAIHTGGGLVLLKALLKNLEGSLKAASLDRRGLTVLSGIFNVSNVSINWVRRSFIARLWSLNKLAKMAKQGDILLCFNGLPPLRKTRARVIAFVQAPYFVKIYQDIRYTKKRALQHKIERLWFALGVKNCDEIWVQTPTMQQAVKTRYPEMVVKVIPLIDEELVLLLASRSGSEKILPAAQSDFSHYMFFYPADAVAHKNHQNLLKAWEILAQQGYFPRLFLTLPSEIFEQILHKTQEKQQSDYPEKTGIVNLGWLSREQVLAQLMNSSALIFPSRAETFGLPMLEARALGIPVIASELDFVRDVCAPVETFNPESPRSIAAAVLRFIEGDALVNSRYYSAQQFVQELLL